MRDALLLAPSDGPPDVVVRVPRLESNLTSPRIGAAALAADLLESPEPRAVSAGTELLNSLAASRVNASS